MIALAMTIALSSSSGSLLAETETNMRHARLIESPAGYTGSVTLGAAPNRPIENMTLAELEQARQEELDNRRGVGGPIAMIVIGGVAIITANVLFAVWPVTSAAVALTGILVGVTVLIAGIVVAAIGVGLLIGAIVRNAKSSQHLRRIENRIDQLRASPQYAPQPMPGDVPPPPPPMPPGAFLDLGNVQPAVTLAEF
ncbi:MAG: hypothetical protein ACO1OB_03375 [Archangium sp.]